MAITLTETLAPPAKPVKRGWQLRGKLTMLPFLGYVTVFLFLPTALVIIGAFQDQSGAFTLANFAKLAEFNTVDALTTSLGISVISALLGAVIGAVAAYALVVGAAESSVLTRVVTAMSSVLAQFAGVMLAFAFIATVGINGIVTLGLKAAVGYQIDPNWLSTIPGIVLVYTYFQIPLMIIVFLPAVATLRPQWREASENLGAGTWTFWLRIGFPVLWPAWAGSFLLLFANAFSAFATAAALFTQRSILVPLMIQSALRNEQDTSQTGFAQVLAFIMVVIVGLVMLLYSRLQRKSKRWQ